jgi:hypothetical protein
MAIIYANGVLDLTVANAEKIAVFSNSPFKIYKQVGFPNFPSQWDLLTDNAAGTYTSAAMSGATVVRVEAGASDAIYETGAAPVIGEPLADQSAADATFVLQGLAAAQGGYVRFVGGTSSTAGNAGGAASVIGGQPGATGVGGAAAVVGGAGGATSGKGGAAQVTGGAGTNGNADGGSVVLQPGALNGSGLDGGVFNRGTYQFRKQAAAVAKGDGAQTITGAQIIGGICVQTITGASTLTTPTGALISAACPTDLAVGDSFDFTLITIGAGADDISTLTAGDGAVTFVGDVTVGPGAAGTTSAGTFRFRNTGAGTWVGYRIG